MANTFKKGIDRNMWVQVPPAPNAHVGAGCLASDLRSDVSRNPFVYQLASATVLNRYNLITKAWNFVISPALAGSFAAGTAMAFVPSLGLVGTIAAGATTTSVVLSTALPTAVGLNMLANRGGSGEYGFKLRIIDTTAGKTAERYIVANTAGTTPTIHVQTSFGFTPSTGARYEIIGGRVFMLAGLPRTFGALLKSRQIRFLLALVPRTSPPRLALSLRFWCWMNSTRRITTPQAMAW
jgi:hypothetical protein